MRNEIPVKNEFLYFVQCGAEGPVKIGKATDLKTRIGMLQVGNPYPLRLVLALEIEPGEANALRLELMIHKLMRDYRVRGEWFEGEMSCRTAEAVAAAAIQRGCGRVVRSLSTPPPQGKSE